MNTEGNYLSKPIIGDDGEIRELTAEECKLLRFRRRQAPPWVMVFLKDKDKEGFAKDPVIRKLNGIWRTTLKDK